MLVETVKIETVTQRLGKENEQEPILIQATEDILEVVKELRRLEELKKRLLELEDIHKQKIMSFMRLHQ